MRIGVDLGGTKIEAVALDDDGTELARRRIATPTTGYPAVIAAIAALVQELEAHCGSTASVGVGTPGAISPFTGLIRNANSQYLNGRPLDRALAEALQRPVALANDADCFALSEATDGAGRGAQTVFGVIIGTGVGAGVVVNGRLLAGPNAIAGEWGHNPLPWPAADELPGPDCYCGRQGCIETFLSGPGMAADHERHAAERLSPERIVAQAEVGDPAAEATLLRYEQRLARSLAHVINILDPHVIVLGGGLSKLQRLYQRVPTLWAPYVFSEQVATRLVPPRFGDASGVRGAAWLC